MTKPKTLFEIFRPKGDAMPKDKISKQRQRDAGVQRAIREALERAQARGLVKPYDVALSVRVALALRIYRVRGEKMLRRSTDGT